jgi:hypothetical protein
MADRFDRKNLRMFPLAQRKNKLDICDIAVLPDSLAPDLPDTERAQVGAVADSIIAARRAGRPVVVTFGAHLIKNGLAPVLTRMMEEGWVTHIATNGAGSIHDWEFACQGQTGEDVRANTASGQFGIWEETGRWANLAIAIGGIDGLGYGASIGRMIADDGLSIPRREDLLQRVSETASGSIRDETLGSLADLLYLVSEFGLKPGKETVEHPFKHYSVHYAAHRLGIPFTLHPGIGYDIIYSHPMNCGGAIGRASVRDFLSYADTISHLSGGVHVSIGSAIMAPMIFEKAMSMSNNLSIQRTGKPMADYHIVVVDIQDGGGWDWRAGEPPPEHPAYYLRFCKSFYRMGGALDYICLDNRAFMLGLCHALSGHGANTR